ncbi:MAG TPA: hypothetical protein VN688_33535 [Gemmataceae bacterium]|nr:hypothetical protein [Gemmataceae bacterium]
MDWQLLIVVVLVILALLYLGRQTLRTWRGKGSSCGGCKCPNTAKKPNSATTTETLIPIEQVTLRRR